MADVDEFARSLLEESKRFLEKVLDHEEEQHQRAYLHAALMLAFCSLEAHVNAIGDDFLERNDTSIHDRGILQELEVKLEKGEFKLTNSTKIIRLDDRIQFLHSRFSGTKLNNPKLWSQIKEATILRNKLTHPKGSVTIKKKDVEQAILAIIDLINTLYLAIYKKPFPASNIRLDSTLTF